VSPWSSATASTSIPSLPELANPTHDAEDIARALRGFGFEVIERKNLTMEDMDSAIAEFGRKISNSEAALFYFAGHGLQVKGQNFLVPVDAKIESEAQVPFKSINVNQLLEEMDSGKSQANIVMLDACRNNPISGKFRSGASRGLAAPSSQPKGTVIVYATDPGNTAADGEGRNGLFTAGLLTAFKGSDLSLHGVLTLASAEVERGSKKTQSPYVNGPMTLQENFYFLPNATINVTAPKASTPDDSVSSKVDPASIELSFWNSIKNSTNPDDFKEYLKQYPTGRFAGLALNRLKPPTPDERPIAEHVPTSAQSTSHVDSREEIEQESWESVKSSGNIDAIQEYLNQYPKGKFVGQAKILIATLKAPKRENPIAQTELPTKPAHLKKQQSKSTYNIGSKGPGGGIVFFLDLSGTHGLEAKTTDEPNLLTWNAVMATNYGPGWRLPTKNELLKLFSQKTVVGGFASGFYWSSSKWGDGSPVIQYFANGSHANIGLNNLSNPDYSFIVRAIQAF
jgi:hypothetical protein